MYGGPGKPGRGGGAGGRTGVNSRMSYPPPSGVRPPVRSGPAGVQRNRLNPLNQAKPGSAAAVEENFSLVPGSNPLAFAMIIRLTPDLVEDIRKVEAQGGNARIKFDANANNTSENVIDVGGKDFKFTWSREMGGLCDIYEERESGEGGDGVLVESACAWRKLNVQRVLDESTTSQVKMRSVEAELKHKSRQAIILDHGNPATKNQLKALAAAESNPFKNSYKQKKEPPFKKRKFDSSPGGPSRLLSQKPVLPSPASVKPTRSASPLLSTPSRVGGSVSPYGASKVNKNTGSLDDTRHTQGFSKEDKPSSEKEGISNAAYAMHANKSRGIDSPLDLQTKIVSLLTDNPKGMTVKALEFAVGDAFSDASKEIELIVQSIAIFQPSSGKYILKPRTESESSKHPLSDIEGLHEHNANVPEHSHQQTPAQEASFADKLFSKENEGHELFKINSQADITTVEKNVIVQDFDTSAQPRSPNKSDDRAGSSSNSGSDSDSDTDSSDSGSDSDSKSKSPVGNGSSSESDSDASTNSKEGSDEYVDIMSEDDKEQKVRMVASGQGVSPVTWRTPDGRPSQNKVYDDDEYYGPVQVEVEKILPNEDEDVEIDVVSDVVPCNGNDKSQMMRDLSPPAHDEHHEHESYGGSSFIDSHSAVKEREQISIPERVSKAKTKSGFDSRKMDEKSDPSKGYTSGNLPPNPKSRRMKTQVPEASGHFSPRNIENDLRMSSPSLMIKRSDRNDDNVDEIRLPKGSREGQSVQPSGNQLPGTMPISQKGLVNMSNSSKHKLSDSMGRGYKNSDRGYSSQYDNNHGDTQNEDVDMKNNNIMTSEHMKPEAARQYKGAYQVSKASIESSPKDDDRYPFINGQSKILHRELSDLEMGELREPVFEEPVGINKKFERERSFKKVDSKQGMSDNQNIDPSKSKPIRMEPVEQEKVLTAATHNKAPKNPEGSLKKQTTEKTKRHQQRTVNPQTQSHLNVDQAAFDKKVSASKTKHDDKKRKVSQAKTNSSADLKDAENDALLPELKRRESSSDENSCSYTKYEKNEPELRGPIKDFSQYKEYVQEYNSKYDSYSSLHKTLESYRSDFLKLGKELENAKGKDEQYNNVLSRLRESYRQSGARHKRLKKIFLVLHEELKQLKEMIKDYAVAYTKD